jgi:alpha-galactosidase
MLGYEIKDADTYALWNVDYLKLDSCNTDGTPPAVEIAIVRDALNATGRPIFFSLCGMCTYVLCFLCFSRYFSIKGGENGWDPITPSLGNSWRTTSDIVDTWPSMISNIHLVNLSYISRI